MASLQDVAADHAVAAVSFAPPGTAAFKHNRGFTAAIVFTSPNQYDLTLEQGLGLDECNLLVTGRNGYTADGEQISATQIRVWTWDGLGLSAGAFDVRVTKVARVGAPVLPPGDPVGVPSGGSSGGGFNPPVFVATRETPTPPGQYATIALAQAACLAAGYGGPGNPRGMVLAMPGDFPENVVMVTNIDVVSLASARIVTATTTTRSDTRIVGQAGGAAVSYAPPIGGDENTTNCLLSGIDVIAAPGEFAVHFTGANPGGLTIANCNVDGGTDNGVQNDNTGGVLVSSVNLVNVHVFSAAAGGAAVALVGGSRLRARGGTIAVASLAATFGVVQTAGVLELDDNDVHGKFNCAGGLATLDDTDVNGAGLGAIEIAGGASVTHTRGNLSGTATPYVVGAGTYAYGCVSLAPGVAPYVAATITQARLPMVELLAGALGVVWAGTVPQNDEEALNRIAAFLATTAAAPIP